ncbi:hypothetical protein OG767_20925 [Micromonospora sp. NBC_01392]|uniref:hypothetical protein n=1 Tax=Micromonospora sp. NBC_01392 TaxID=2903588 RepID=UPI00324CB269
MAAAALVRRGVTDPEPLPYETLVRIDAFAPNPGDIVGLDDVTPGTVPGWDGSGAARR